MGQWRKRAFTYLVDVFCRGDIISGREELETGNIGKSISDVVKALDDGLEIALVPCEVRETGYPSRQSRRESHATPGNDTPPQVLAHGDSVYNHTQLADILLHHNEAFPPQWIAS